MKKTSEELIEAVASGEWEVGKDCSVEEFENASFEFKTQITEYYECLLDSVAKNNLDA